MTIAKLRRVGGSTMLAIPPAMMEALQLTLDTPVSLRVDSGKLTVAAARPRYKLADLLAQCEGGPLSEEDKVWINATSVGREI
jgi:antitoxin ChpS